MEDQTEIDLLAEQVKGLPYESLVELEQGPKALPIVGNYKQQMQNAYSGIQDLSKKSYTPSPELTEQISGARADYDKANQPMQEDMLSKIITSFGPAILGGLSGESGKLAQLPASKQANELYAAQRKEQQGEQEKNRARALKRYEELVGSKKAEREAFDKSTQREIDALKSQASGARDMAGLDIRDRAVTDSKTARAGKSKEMNVAQAKQLGLYQSGLEAERQYQEAVKDKNEYDPTKVGQIIDNSGWAPNFMKNDKAIEAQAAQSAWIEAFLRDASGAAIPPSERGAYAVDFFPQPGDTPSVVKNKEALRKQKMENAKIGSGESIPEKAPATSKKPSWAL